MKKLAILFVSIGILLSSCSSNDNESDDKGSISEASVIGKWKLTKRGNILDGSELLLTITPEGGCSNDQIEFLENGNYKEFEYEYTNSKCKEYTNDGTWLKSNNTLKLKDILNNETSYEILRLDETSLRLKITKGKDNAVYKLLEYTRK
ncbi:lipocalin family protein [Flavobacterium sp. DG2-3]|uniref:lipocalin family protein n=1 Tax=Flavobacterium sp. DG2-3 TaxID=3068317 RepID=UPI00273D7380|nr:lipocalin family protein [Flavobacterium sp. DG2-3]MDP5199401.1 lipocalin family protein [Flavobacterium sp. DG2-3]